MSTVSLQMIIKDERDAVNKIVQAALPYFDKINLTVSDKPTANFLKKVAKAVPQVNVVWREWTDRFDQARNDNFKLCDTTYAFWIDADDYFDFSTIPEMVKIADENEIDAIFLPYNYAQDAQGNCITRHWRERLIRMDAGFEWRGWVHETLVNDKEFTSHKINNEVVHMSNKDVKESAERNHKILEKAYKEDKDPRYLHYLGMSWFTKGDYEKSISLLSDYLKVGGSVEDHYRALSTISESAYHLNEHPKALDFATKAMVLKPEYPMAYWLLAQYEADQKNWEEALEWVRTSESKKDPQTLSVWDPSARERAILIAAQAEFMLERYNRALAWLRKIPNNAQARELIDVFTDEADAETFLLTLPKMRKFFKSDELLWKALCKDIQFDKRLKTFRNKVTKPITWEKNTITIFCGEGYEEWGPHTLDKGMGGSEEAIVYLTEELWKLGWDVTVYGEYDSGPGTAVQWRHWKEIDTRDKFNVFVSWRAPQYLKAIDARVKLADIHDVLPESVYINQPDINYMVKSQYHKDLTPNIKKAKFHVIGNGIKKSQFKENK